MKREIAELDNYAVKSNDIKKYENKVLDNAKIPDGGIKKIIKGFRDGDFLIKYFDDDSEQPSGSTDKQESEESEQSDEIDFDWTYNATNKKIKDLKKSG